MILTLASSACGAEYKADGQGILPRMNVESSSGANTGSKEELLRVRADKLTVCVASPFKSALLEDTKK